MPWNNPCYPVLAYFCTLKISVRSQKLCLTIPKMLPDNRQASFLGSQKLCLTINCKYLYSCPVRHNFWDLRRYPRNVAWQWFWVEMMDSLLSGIIFGISETIPEMMPDDCQATFLGSSGIILGISRLFVGYKKKPKQGNQGCFRAFKRVFLLSICAI